MDQNFQNNPHMWQALRLVFVWFDSYAPCDNFSVITGWVFLTKQRIKCLAQGHKAVPPVRLEPDMKHCGSATSSTSKRLQRYDEIFMFSN